MSERITMQALADSGSNPFAYRIQSNKAGGAPLIYHNWDAHPSLSISEGWAGRSRSLKEESSVARPIPALLFAVTFGTTMCLGAQARIDTELSAMARSGSPFAHVAVCRAHYVGNGVPQDSVEEVCCFGKAAEQGSAEGEAAHASLRRTPARIHSRRKLASTVEWPTCTRRSAI